MMQLNISAPSFRGASAIADVRVFDALWARTRNAEASAALITGFRVRRFAAPRNDN
jgi:hypothetical protein